MDDLPALDAEIDKVKQELPRLKPKGFSGPE
jgi:hypothetical protein